MTDTDIIVRILVSLLLGGIIGFEREATGHVAGLRTNMLVCVGSTLFMIAAELLTIRYSGLNPAPDPSRIASTIVTGIGFLGAGVIFQSRKGIRNLTTAASIWVMAAIGMLVGAGFYMAATSGTLITFVVLAVLPTVERWLHRRSRARSTHSADDDNAA